MTAERCIAANVARLRLDRQLTQDQLAVKAGISRMAIGKIERGAVVPRARTLNDLAGALAVPVGDLVTPVRPLESVRFRAKAQINARERILARVSKWLGAYAELEAKLVDHPPFRFEDASTSGGSPSEVAQAARRAVGLTQVEPVRNIGRLLEENGVKLLLLETKRDSFFGLSVGKGDGGPAVVVNTWERISVERWIFTAAHELGHLLLHPSEYRRDATRMEVDTEQEADAFASEFLMPESAFTDEWNATGGLSLLERVLKVKLIFQVSYKTVLHRLVESGRETPEVWRTFQRQHRSDRGKTLRKIEEPEAIGKGEFAWNWSRSGEPDGLSEHYFVEGRLSDLVRQAFEKKLISLERAGEILGIDPEQMKKRAAEWAGQEPLIVRDVTLEEKRMLDRLVYLLWQKGLYPFHPSLEDGAEAVEPMPDATLKARLRANMSEFSKISEEVRRRHRNFDEAKKWLSEALDEELDEDLGAPREAIDGTGRRNDRRGSRAGVSPGGEIAS